MTIISPNKKEEIMSNIIRKINDDIFASKITQEELRKYLKISSGSLSEILNGHTEISFEYLAKILILLYDDPMLRREIVLDYIAYAKPENCREALEYLSYRREYKLLKVVIRQEKKSDTPMNRIWANVYELIYKRHTKKYEPDVFINKLEEMKCINTDKDMDILIDILICQASYQSGDYRLLTKRMQRIEKRISKIKKKYIRNSFSTRVKEGMSAVYLMDKQLEKARKNCFEVLELCEKDKSFIMQKAHTLYNLGESYLFEVETYDLAKRYLEAALEVLASPFNTEMRRAKKIFLNTLNFLKIYYNRDLSTLPKKLHPAEKALLEFRKGNNEKAIQILLDLEIKQGSLTPHQMFVLGLIKNDPVILKQSLKILEDKGSIYAKLPEKHLGII